MTRGDIDCIILFTADFYAEENDMIIDVTELMNHRTEKIGLDYTFDAAHADCPLVDLPGDVTIPENGIHVTGCVCDSLGLLMFRAHVSAEYKTSCARCLDEVTGKVEFDIERSLITSGGHGSCDSHISDDGEWDGETDDVLAVNDARIIPDGEIFTELSLELPVLSLCSPDCPGLCRKCGKKLKDGPCGCENEKEINPNFAILQKLLDN